MRIIITWFKIVILNFRYEFQTGLGSGNLPHVHSLYSLEGTKEEKEAIFSKITARQSDFDYKNEKFDANKCAAAGNIINQIYGLYYK